MPGLWFEEFSPGQTFDHPITRTVTEMDNMLFSNMTLNPQPLHIDFHFAAGTEFGKPLVNSLFTLGLMIGISVHDTTLKTTIANLGMTDVNFPAPVFHGELDPCRHDGRIAAGEQIEAGRGARHLQTQGFQPGRQRSGELHPRRPHAQASRPRRLRPARHRQRERSKSPFASGRTRCKNRTKGGTDMRQSEAAVQTKP